MTLYAVIDTNVLVSAFLKENSIPRYVINTMYAGNIIPIYNAEIIAEYTAVLHRPKFCFPPAAVDIVVNEIQEIGLKFDGISVKEPMPDPKDIVFYAVTPCSGAIRSLFNHRQYKAFSDRTVCRNTAPSFRHIGTNKPINADLSRELLPNKAYLPIHLLGLLTFRYTSPQLVAAAKNDRAIRRS